MYDAVPGKLPDVLSRFATHTLKFFQQHGIKVVGSWTEEIGTSNRLIYMLAFDSLADREKKWTAFMSNQDWLNVRAETEANGPLVARVVNTMLRPTSFSPMQ